MEQCLSSDANRFSACQGIIRILCKRKFHYRFYKSLQPVTVHNTVVWLQPELEWFSVWQP